MPVGNLNAKQKAELNRQGNMLFNRGELEAAKRIFLTTGYSDGLSRIGDYYTKKGRQLDALKMYWLAHDRRKSDPVIDKLAELIESMVN